MDVSGIVGPRFWCFPGSICAMVQAAWDGAPGHPTIINGIPFNIMCIYIIIYIYNYCIYIYTYLVGG